MDTNSIKYIGQIVVKYIDFDIKPPSFAMFVKKADETIGLGANILFKRRNEV